MKGMIQSDMIRVKAPVYPVYSYSCPVQKPGATAVSEQQSVLAHVSLGLTSPSQSKALPGVPSVSSQLSSLPGVRQSHHFRIGRDHGAPHAGGSEPQS